MRTGLAVVGLILAGQVALGCPFCAKMSHSYSDDFRQADSVVFGTLQDARTDSPDGPKTTLIIRDVLQSGDRLFADSTVQLDAFIGPAKNRAVDRLLFLNAVEGKLTPSRVLPASDELLEYLTGVAQRMNSPQTERLAYFFDHLDSKEPLVSADAYAEFAKASYRATAAAASSYNPERLRSWLDDPQTPADRVGLFGLLLGLCGKEEDVSRLVAITQEPSPVQLVGLDGVLGGLCVLDYEAGVDRVVEIINAEGSSLARRLAAVAALEFLLLEMPPRDPKPLVLRTLPGLKHADVAGALIDELRRAGCWNAWPQVLEHGSELRDPGSLMRFALRSPEPAAIQFVERMKQQDPGAIVRAEQDLQFEASTRQLFLPGSQR